MNWINYLLEANLYLALFYVTYYLLLRRDTYYQLNRIYLLTSSLLAFIIPLLQIGILKPVHLVVQLAVPTTAYVIQSPQAHVNDIATPAAVPINYYLVLYIVVALILSVGLGIRLYQLVKLARKGRHTTAQNFNIIEIEDEEHAFSFFSYLFIGKQLSASETIIQHELVHIRQKHSIDIMYLEILKIVCWFNPIAYLLQNSMKEVHEFIADSQIATTKDDVNMYTDFLISNAYGLPETALANNFFNKNLLKTRIMMLHQKRSGSLARLKYLVALPLLTGMLCLSTLGFTKDYTLLDLAPGHQPDSLKRDPPPPPAPPVVTPQKLPPPPPTAPLTKSMFTSKGYKFKEDGNLVNGKSNFRVTITDKNGEQKSYFRNTAIAADIKLLSEKYGYAFPTMEIHTKMPPPPPVNPAENAMAPPPPPVNVPGADDTINKDHPFETFYKYIAQHVRYPTASRNNNIQGKVFVVFNVNDDRGITNVFVARGLTEEMNNEVVRVIKNYKAIPEFKTDINYTIPLAYALQGDDGKYVDSKPYMNTTDKATITETYKKTGFKNIALNEIVVVGFPPKK
jgi:TonB family protein